MSGDGSPTPRAATIAEVCWRSVPVTHLCKLPDVAVRRRGQVRPSSSYQPWHRPAVDCPVASDFQTAGARSATLESELLVTAGTLVLLHCRAWRVYQFDLAVCHDGSNGLRPNVNSPPPSTSLNATKGFLSVTPCSRLLTGRTHSSSSLSSGASVGLSNSMR